MKKPWMKKKNPINVTLILSVFLSVALWLFVITENNPETVKSYYDIPVSILNEDKLKPKELIVMNKKNYKIMVELKGVTSDFMYFDKDNIKASIDLNGYSEGEMKVPVKVELQSSNSNIKLKEIQPREIMIDFEKIIEVEKPINLIVDGELETGLVKGIADYERKRVLLKGPRREVNKVAEALVYIDVSGRKDDTSLAAPIELLDSSGKKVETVSYSPEVIDVIVPILKTKTIPIEIVTTGELPAEYVRLNADIEPNLAIVMGKEPDLMNLVKIDTNPVDINDFVSNPKKVVSLNLPKGVFLVNADTKFEANVILEKLAYKSFSIPVSKIKAENIAPGTKVLINDETPIKVTIWSEESVIEKMTENDITLLIDVLNLEKGEHTVNLKMSNSASVSNQQIEPATILIEIQSKGEEG